MPHMWRHMRCLELRNSVLSVSACVAASKLPPARFESMFHKAVRTDNEIIDYKSVGLN